MALNNKNSKILDVIYGVPHGSVLGPLLFLIYINDIPNLCELAKFIMYADDANILITGNSNAEIEKIFTKLANNFETWVNSNGLVINLKKTNYMIFANRTVQDLPFTPKLFKYEIERKRVARFLGVIINEKLTWKDHVLSVKAKMSRYVGILFKLKTILPLTARKNIYYSFVQSYLNYCSLVWGLGSKSNIEPLFTEQKRQYGHLCLAIILITIKTA